MPEVSTAESPVGVALDRIVALAVLAAGAAAALLLAQVPPDPRGYGTHELLGLRPCSWPARVGAPCPTCGVTTAACLLVHLQPLAAFAAQPFGAALAAAGLLAAVDAGRCLVTGRSFVERLARLPYGTIAVGAAALFLLAWLYKYLTFPA